MNIFVNSLSTVSFCF